MEMILKTPAKINLALHILGKREDGFHELETILQMVALYDCLEFEPIPSGLELICTDPTIPADETNLVMKAARLLEKKFPKLSSRQGYRMHLHKTIPHGAGLGGGSGNAAGTMLALNYLWDLRQRRDEMIILASQLGSDVPFFLLSPCALGMGRGEILKPLQPIKYEHIILVYPNIYVSTAWAYSKLNLKLTKNQKNISILQKFLSLSEVSRLGSLLQNDIEPVVFEEHSKVLNAKNQLRDTGAEGVLMSGSGSAIFGIYKDFQRAKDAFKVLQRENKSVFLTQTIQNFSEYLPDRIVNYP